MCTQYRLRTKTTYNNNLKMRIQLHPFVHGTNPLFSSNLIIIVRLLPIKIANTINQIKFYLFAFTS